MTWTYEQSTGHLRDTWGDLAATGYSGGNCGKNPEGKNNPAMQSIPFVGPIPQGSYVFGQPVEHSRLGPFAIPLIPSPTNLMFGRSDFYVHGDSIDAPGCASEGCVIVPLAVRQRMWASADHVLEVV